MKENTMTKNEHKTFDKLLELIITKGMVGKDILDMLCLISRMKYYYIEGTKEN